MIRNCLGILLVLCFFILFESCNSSILLIKRHYRSGYYLKKEKKQPPIRVAKWQQGRGQSLAKSVDKEINTLPIDSKLNSFETSKRISNHMQTLSNKNESCKNLDKGQCVKQRNSSMEKKSSPLTLAFNDKVFPNSYKKPFSLLSDNDIKDHGSGEDLSMFWVVILVIMLVWLIALLTGGWGLGGFIHILLIAALVLLVLWILRIV